MQVHDSAVMVLLPYTPRADSDARGYDAWLRTVDNPFFNRAPGILHYSNWKFADQANSPGFTHFDFMILESRASAELVWGNAAVVDFAAGWTRQWGRDPGNSDLSVNYHSAIARRRSGALARRSNRLWLGLEATAEAAADSEIWDITEPLVGTPAFTSFCFRFIPSESAAGDAASARDPGAGWAGRRAEAVLIAAPD